MYLLVFFYIAYIYVECVNIRAYFSSDTFACVALPKAITLPICGFFFVIERIERTLYCIASRDFSFPLNEDRYRYESMFKFFYFSLFHITHNLLFFSRLIEIARMER